MKNDINATSSRRSSTTAACSPVRGRPSIARSCSIISREVLRLLHVDLEDENLLDTPRRWAESLITMTSGYDFTDVKKLTTLFRKACSAADEKCQNLVVIGGTYKTLCAHHILPFFGQFIIGYIPDKMIIGASKIPRIVEVHMRRLQSQEHLAHDVADTIEQILEPNGIAVWMGGVHLCMVMRGVEQESSFMETNVLRGAFLERRADAAGVHVHREPARAARVTETCVTIARRSRKLRGSRCLPDDGPSPLLSSRSPSWAADSRTRSRASTTGTSRDGRASTTSPTCRCRRRRAQAAQQFDRPAAK